MNLFRAAVSLAVLAAAFPAAAAKDPPKPPSFWTQEPDAQARAAAWPDAARKQGVGGRAAMACNVQPDGALKDCQLIAESPGGMGFGQALLKLVPQYRRNLADYPGPRAVVSAHWYEIDTRPDWVKQPTARDILAVFPRGALQKGRDGQAMIECVVTVHGSLNDCIAIWETPDGEGFGRAAIGLAPQFGMKPATRQGRPTPAMVRIPVNFRTSGRVDSSQLKRVAPAAMAWAEAPSYADVVAAYPAKARADKLAGRATIQCQLTREGRLKACDTHADTPKGRGFGVAAKELAKKFRIEVAEKDRGLTDEIVVHLPFVFDPAMLSPEAQVVGKPSWARLPTPEDMKAAIAPLKLAATARAQLACVVQPGGGVDACKVVGEDPAASGVGAAALALAPKFRLTTWTSEGLPTVGGTVRIPLRFEP